jgi:hypothetical protein
MADKVTITKQLPLKISEQERDTKAREAAGFRHAAKMKGEELKKLSDPLKKEIKGLEDKAEALETAAATGELLADVEVREEKDFQRNEIRLVRADTGETIEGPRAMTGNERRSMTVEDEGGAAEEGGEGTKSKRAKGGRKHKVKLPAPGSQNN